MKILAFLITLLINLGSGVFCFFMLLLSLNGFSSKQAEPGLILFVVWVVITALVAAVLSVLGANYLAGTKSLNQWLAGFIAVAVFGIGGAVVNFVGVFVAAFLVSAMR